MKKQLPKIIGLFINLTSYFSSKFAAKIAMNLFSTPRKGKTTYKQLEFLETAIRGKVKFENITVQTYHWKGEKDTILLVHGWESNTSRWKDLIASLKKENYNIVALDAPAHGSSGGKYFNAPIYAECINLVVKKFNPQSIIGHSIGGMSTVFFQHNYQPKSIEKLVLLGTPADFLGILKRYELMMSFSTRVSKALKNHILKHFKHLPEYFSPANFSKNITVKGLVIHDKNDKIIPYKDGLNLKQNYSNATFISTEGLGHSLKSESVYQHILNFLND